jgi:hypothetical protein
VEEGERESGRREVHGNQTRFGEWVEGKGGKPDLGVSLSGGEVTNEY